MEDNYKIILARIRVYQSLLQSNSLTCDLVPLLLVRSSDVVWQRLDALLLLELLRRLRVLPPPVRRPVALRKIDDVDVDSLKRNQFC